MSGPLEEKRPSAARLALPGMLLVLVFLLPFLHKAYTIDDPWFLLEARQILRTPLQPMSFPVCWMGNEICRSRASSLGAGAAQGLMGYLLVPVVEAGAPEWLAHVLQMLLASIAAFEMARLARRLGFTDIRASAAGLLLAAIPPFLPMASSAMPDIAALALGISGMERLLAWKEEGRWHQAVAAGLALGLAPYARPHLALLLPLGSLWLLNDYRPPEALRDFLRHPVRWTPILLAAGTLIGVNLLTRDRGPADPLVNSLIGPANIPFNLFFYLLYLAFPIPFAAVWLGVNWRKSPALVGAPVAAIVVLHFTLLRARSLTEQAALLGAFFGLAALGSMLRRYVRERDRLGLLLSLWLLIPVPAVAYLHLPIKYMVGVMPAIVLILIRTLAVLPKRREFSAYAALVLACGALSWIILQADADFAEGGRRAAAELIAPYVAKGEKVWFGGQWGFYWYAQEAGATVANPHEPGPRPGDLLAVGLMEGGGVTRNRFPNRDLIDARHYPSPHGRTMGYGGGLYSNRVGLLVWVWKPEATSDYELCRIR